MALTKQVPIVLLLLLLVALGMQQTSSGFHLNISPLSVPKDQMEKSHTIDEASPAIVPSGAPAWLWGSVSSADVGTVCEQVSASGNLSFGITVSMLGFQEELHIQIKRLEGCKSSTDHAGTQALLIDNTGGESTVSVNPWTFCEDFRRTKRGPVIHKNGCLARNDIICPSNAGIDGCKVYMLAHKDVSNFKANNIRDRRMLIAVDPAGLPNRGCFPGDARVYMASGEMKNMDELGLGDQVAVRIADGTIAYEEIYAFGHKDPTAIANFFSFKLASVQGKASTGHESRYIELTSGHFVPILSGTGGQEIVYKRGVDIKIGDLMLASPESAQLFASTNAATGLVPYVVTDISENMRQGLFNPYTMSGTIVVNGIVASSHSEWFLDDLFDKLGLTCFLPATYQAILATPRLLYKVLGKELYIATYAWLDLHTNVIKFASTYQGGGPPSMWVATAIGGPLSILLFSWQKKKNP